MTPYNLLSEEARQKRLEYLREWRKKNPDRVRSYANAYWNKRATKNNTQTDKERENNDGNAER